MQVNISIKAFKAKLAQADERGTTEERARLRRPGLFPGDLFNGLADGRIIDLRTWMTAARADMRGKLALGKLAPWTTGVGIDGKPQRKPPTPEAIAEAIVKQHELLERMRKECPVFFSSLVETPAEDPDAFARRRAMRDGLRELTQTTEELGGYDAERAAAKG